jgi:type IV secretion system protein VirB5
LKQSDAARFSADLQALLVAERQAVARGQILNRAAFARSSDRFTKLQTLIDQIGAAPDAKAIAELQGRIGAEQAMVANEGLKLATLAQVAGAESDARALARREQVVANHGGFATRFQPTPPAP